MSLGLIPCQPMRVICVKVLVLVYYRIYCMYSDRQAYANSVDPDEMLQNVVIRVYTVCHSSSNF